MNAGRQVPPAYLALFTSLYALQGVVVAYFFNFNQQYMRSSGVGLEEAAGVQSLALVPFILKFLVGPLSDRVSPFGLGHRKPYVVAGVVLESLGLIGLSWLDPSRSLSAFTAVAIVTVAGLALYDTCCDGMVIDVTPAEDRSRVQGSLVASRALAAMVCSVAFGVWLDRGAPGPGRYHRVLWACSALGIVPLALGLVLPEPRRAADAELFRWSALRVLVLPRSLVLLAFGALYSIVGYGAEINLSPFYKSLGFPESRVGALASARYVGRAAGAALMPLAMHRLGRGGTLALGVVALAVATAGQGLVAGSGKAAAGAVAFGAANGWDDAVFFVLAMEASDPRMAASTYALFMAVTNVSVAGGWLFARVVSVDGGRYGPAFVASGLVSLAAVAFVPALSRPARKPEPLDVDA